MKRFFYLILWLQAGFITAQDQFSVYFDSDRYELTSSELNRLKLWINEQSKAKILSIYGYTDEDGSIGYNDTLARRRVDHVYKQIDGKVAIREDFKTRSFGKLHQQSDRKAENRRVTIFYLEEKDRHLEDEILGITKEEPKRPKVAPEFPKQIVLNNPDGTRSVLDLDVDFMKRVSLAEPGQNLLVENLNFHLNTFAIVQESRPRLYELLLVMQNNPGLVIEIEGHICCIVKDRVDLSTQRAKAIKNFLVSNGIDGKRVTFKGYGSTRPVYPVPEKTEEERAANRRVEIKIVAND